MSNGTPVYGCLVTDEGTLCIPLRWGTTGAAFPWRFLPVQMWDTQGQPMAQPYETPADYDGDPLPEGMWLVDLTALPAGFRLVGLSPSDWQKTQHNVVAHRYDASRATLTLREEYVQIGDQVKLKAGQTRTIAYTVRGGIPIYRDTASGTVLLPTGLDALAAALADAVTLARATQEEE
jgi:hypothetical protein